MYLKMCCFSIQRDLDNRKLRSIFTSKESSQIMLCLLSRFNNFKVLGIDLMSTTTQNDDLRETLDHSSISAQQP